MSSQHRTWSALITVVAVTLAGSLLTAHHSISGLFDERKNLALTGVLTAFRFAEPHGLMSVEITNPRGQSEIWRAETNGRSSLGRDGWTTDTLKIGEAVTVEGFPAQGGVKRLRLRKITRADGTVLLSASDPAAQAAVR